MQYRRAAIQGGTYFFTIVTYKRIKMLCTPHHIGLLRNALKSVKKRLPFQIEAVVVLPDHLHCILTLPENDADFPTRLRQIKSHFSRNCLDLDHENSLARIRKRERPIWQRRYWEHLIRDEEDFIRHVDYIHYNPVKHRLVEAPRDWPFSSFHQYVKRGLYDRDWGDGQDMVFEDELGNE